MIEAVDARMEAPRQAGSELTLGGQPLALDSAAPDGAAVREAEEAGEDAREAEAAAAARDLAAWLRGADPGPGGAEPGLGAGGTGFGASGAEDPDEWRRRELEQGMGQRELLLGSSFSFAAGDERTGHYALWGRGAVTRFDGREGTLTLDGEVASAFLGADWRRERTTLGLMLGHSVGDGGYASEAGRGAVSATLTGLYPWLRLGLTDRVSVWGVAGYGEGTLTLTPANEDPGSESGAGGAGQAALRTDLGLAMGAVGLRGLLLQAPETGGVELSVKTDAMAVRTRSVAVTGSGGNLAGATAEVTRLRLGLEGARAFRFAGGAALTPSLEVGVRHDGGDAETGFGVDAGGSLAWSDPARGLSTELSGRALIAHAEDGYREWGAGASVVLDPGADGRGLSLRLAPAWGTAEGGAERLWAGDAGALANLATDPGSGSGSGDGAANDTAPAMRLDAELGYGLGALGGKGVLTPYAGLGLAGEGARDFRLGTRLDLAPSLSLSLEGTRRESDGAEPEHGVRLELRAGF